MGSRIIGAGESGNFTVPNGIGQLTVSLWGSGASGEAAFYDGGNAVAKGGGGGGYIENWLYAVTPHELIAYAAGVAALGVALLPAGNNGLVGQDTTFGTLIARGGGNNIGTWYLGGDAIAGGHTALGGTYPGSNPDNNGAIYDHGDGGKLYGGGPGGCYDLWDLYNGWGGNSKGAGGVGVRYADDLNAGGGGASKGNGGRGGTQGDMNQTDGTDGGGGGSISMSAAAYTSAAGGPGGIIITWTDPQRGTVMIF